MKLVRWIDPITSGGDLTPMHGMFLDLANRLGEQPLLCRWPAGEFGVGSGSAQDDAAPLSSRARSQALSRQISAPIGESI
jgi:hypothetical protein